MLVSNQFSINHYWQADSACHSFSRHDLVFAAHFSAFGRFFTKPIQLRRREMYPNYCYPPPFHSVAAHCSNMLRIARVAMLHLTNMGTSRPKRWCIALVLLAVCALTLSVTTRYGTAQLTPDHSQTVVTNTHSWTPGLQRLLNNASTWIPPVVTAAILQSPGYSRHISQPAPRILSVQFEKNLYNRPPPCCSLP